MAFTLWCLVIGTLCIAIALMSSQLARLPLSASLLYLGAGFALGPAGIGLLELDPFNDAGALERVTEIVLVVSLFSAGLKLRVPLRDPVWRLATRLAVVTMVITTVFVGALAHLVLALPMGAALLLGAILSPTDPVLAGDVRVTDPLDTDKLRFGLTGEASLNDGTAFPFVILALGLLGHHDLGRWGLHWLGVDVLATGLGGLVIGTVFGSGVAKLVVYLRSRFREALGTDDFLALGLLALTFGVSLLTGANAFLAALAAGLALRRAERDSVLGQAPVQDGSTAPLAEDASTHPDKAPSYMAQAVLGFTEQLERIGEVGVLLVVGSLLSEASFAPRVVVFILALFFVVRPAAVYLGLWRYAPLRGARKLLIAWFGMRGIGSLFYVFYVIQHGIPTALGRELLGVTLATIAASAVFHGITVTPLMDYYQKLSSRRVARATRPLALAGDD